jgi:outer membrane protein assembly factor BamB
LNTSTVGRLSLSWSYTTGNQVYSSPAVVNGVIYVGSLDNNVYALNAASGAQLWSFTTGNQVPSSPAVANGVVYVGSYDSNVYALNSSTGAPLWSFTAGSGVGSSPVVADGVVYVGSFDGNVYALDAAGGAKLWSFTTGGAVFSSPAVANGVSMWALSTTVSTRSTPGPATSYGASPQAIRCTPPPPRLMVLFMPARSTAMSRR